MKRYIILLTVFACISLNGYAAIPTDYYPFGAAHGNAQNPERQPYKFGGKELDEMHGLNQYDFHARRMSRDIPRFTTMDPLAEKYYSISPYAYYAGNPVRFKEPYKSIVITMHGTWLNSYIWKNFYRILTATKLAFNDELAI
jgi:RHS repeat-associated protein